MEGMDDDWMNDDWMNDDGDSAVSDFEEQSDQPTMANAQQPGCGATYLLFEVKLLLIPIMDSRLVGRHL
jgi:hypothetical protein